VASAAQVPAAHRSTAEMVPEKIRARMTSEELRHRAAYCHRIESGPQTGDAKRALFALSRKILRSIPIREYIESRAKFHQLAADAPSGINSPAFEFRSAAAKLKADNAYPPGLEAACERRLLGKEPGYPEADVDQILGLPARDMRSK
jgi:hypothetical protein